MSLFGANGLFLSFRQSFSLSLFFLLSFLSHPSYLVIRRPRLPWLPKSKGWQNFLTHTRFFASAESIVCQAAFSILEAGFSASTFCIRPIKPPFASISLLLLPCF
jgi:hypothetical protein